MKITVVAAILVCLCCSIVSGFEDLSEYSELESLLPLAGEVSEWAPREAPELAIEEELYIVIDGGADIYYEYGFRAALFQTYFDDDGHSINLEIYEMSDPEAAYGIYTFKTGDNGTPLDIGCEGWFESYYLNFWEGNYLVTVTGLGTTDDILSGVKNIARAVDSKLKIESKRPILITYLPDEYLQPNGITYIKGTLGLFNRYRFAPENIFGVNEGVIGMYDGFSVFVFQYNDREESLKWYDQAKNHLAQSKRFTKYKDYNARLKMNDLQDHHVSIYHHLRWIIAVVSEEDGDASRSVKSLKARLKL